MKSAHEVWKYAQKRGLNDKEFKELLIKEGIIIKKLALGWLCETHNDMKDFPRRNQLDKCVPAELAIFNAIEEVEKVGADPKLTSAIMKLQEAKEFVSDFVDSHRNHKYYTCKDCGFRFILADNASQTDIEIFNSFSIFHMNPILQIPCRKELIEITEQDFLNLTFDS